MQGTYIIVSEGDEPESHYCNSEDDLIAVIRDYMEQNNDPDVRWIKVEDMNKIEVNIELYTA